MELFLNNPVIYDSVRKTHRRSLYYMALGAISYEHFANNAPQYVHPCAATEMQHGLYIYPKRYKFSYLNLILSNYATAKIIHFF